MLLELNYLRFEGEEIIVTDSGKRLSMIYGERDLLTAECLERGIWSALEPSALASMISTLVFEARREEDYSNPRLPKGDFEQVFYATCSTWSELENLGRRYKLRQTDQPDATVALSIFRWCNGVNLDRILLDSGLLVGDFIRLSKQIIDLLEQISRASDGPTSENAKRAVDLMKRGVVAYSYLS